MIPGRYFHVQSTAQKIKLSIKDFFLTDLVTFTGEILNGKFHFLCSGLSIISSKFSTLQSKPFPGKSLRIVESCCSFYITELRFLLFISVLIAQL